MASTQNKHHLISKRYSDALVQLAEGGRLSYEKISSDLNVVESTLSQSLDLNEFLNNPLISVDDKKEIIIKVFSNEIDDLIVNFLKVLVDKDRFSAFKEVTISFKEALDKVNNISRVKVTSAVNLPDDTKNRLKSKLEEKMQKAVVLDWEINPNIIAGLVIQMGDNIIDTSLKQKLEDLSKTITK
jgi:F-type H+-transporting ATPase subunit delta